MRAWTTAAVLIITGLALAAAPALAQSRAVVADFGGAGSGAIRNHAVRGLSGESGIELVSSDEFEAAGGLDDLAGASSSLNLAAVVEGTVARRGRRWAARITVRGGSGDELAEQTFVSRNLRGLGSAVRRGVGRRIADAIRGAEASGGAAEAEEEEEENAARVRSGGGVRVVVRPFDGPGAGRARALVVGDLGEHVDVVSTGESDDVADRLDVDLGTPDGRVAVARELQINAWVDGTVQRQGRRSFTANVRVTNGYDGFLVEEVTFRGRSAGQLVSRIRGSVWPRLGSAIQSSRPPARPSGGGGGGGGDEDDYVGEDEEWDDDVSGPSGPRPPAFLVSGSLRILSRRLSYKNDLFGQLRAYELGGAPAIGVMAHWYPAAHFTDGFAANLGLDFRGEVGVGLQSADSSGTEYPTDTSAWSLGARVRIPLADGIEAAPLLHYGRHYYAIQAANVDNPKPDVPDVAYQFVRIGAEGTLSLDLLRITARLGWLQMLGAGEIESDVWFPRLSVGGVEAGVVVGYAVTETIEVQAGVDVRRYYYTMNPEPGDPWIAGGGADQYLAGALGLSWVP
jgi:hypothetical protein